MDENKKRNILLAVAFLLPLLFIAIIFISSLLPTIQLSTEFNFVYATCSKDRFPSNYYCVNHLQNLYVVQNSRLVEQEIPADLDSDNDGVLDSNENYVTRLFIHDTESNLSRELSLAEAQSLQLDKKIVSPDGVAVEWEFRGGSVFFPFVNVSSRYGWYLSRGNARQRLELIGDNDRSYYQDDFMFLGWVIND